MLSGEFVTKSIHTKKAHPNKAATRPRQRNNSPQAKKAKSARLSGCRQAKAGKFSSKTLHADPYQDEKSVAASCGFRPWNKRVSLDCRDRPPDCPNRTNKVYPNKAATRPRQQLSVGVGAIDDLSLPTGFTVLGGCASIEKWYAYIVLF